MKLPKRKKIVPGAKAHMAHTFEDKLQKMIVNKNVIHEMGHHSVGQESDKSTDGQLKRKRSFYNFVKKHFQQPWYTKKEKLEQQRFGHV